MNSGKILSFQNFIDDAEYTALSPEQRAAATLEWAVNTAECLTAKAIGWRNVPAYIWEDKRDIAEDAAIKFFTTFPFDEVAKLEVTLQIPRWIGYLLRCVHTTFTDYLRQNGPLVCITDENTDDLASWGIEDYGPPQRQRTNKGGTAPARALVDEQHGSTSVAFAVLVDKVCIPKFHTHLTEYERILLIMSICLRMDYDEMAVTIASEFNKTVRPATLRVQCHRALKKLDITYKQLTDLLNH